MTNIYKSGKSKSIYEKGNELHPRAHKIHSKVHYYGIRRDANVDAPFD